MHEIMPSFILVDKTNHQIRYLVTQQLIDHNILKSEDVGPLGCRKKLSLSMLWSPQTTARLSEMPMHHLHFNGGLNEGSE